MDEVGRGTSSSDGEALAYSIARYISKNIKCLTLFATHYLRVAELSVKNNKIKNKYTKAIEYDGGITFLYKMINGIAPKSYGIQVAKMAGLPLEVVKRAEQILEHYLSNDMVNCEETPDTSNNQLVIFDDRDQLIKNKLKEIDLESMTPIEAIKYLDDLKKEHNL